MSLNPHYVFSLIDSDTFIELDGLGSASGRVFKPQFNGPGELSLTVPLDSDAAYLARKHKTGAVIFRNTRPIWSGEMITSTKDGQANTSALSFKGWENELDRRYVRRTDEASLKFPTPGETGGDIVEEQVTAVNSQTDSDGTVRPTRVSFGSSSDTQVRIRTYKGGDNFGQNFKELRDIENGLDYSMDPISKQIATRAPTEFADLTGLHFGYNIDPHNLDNCIETDDGSNTANRVNVVGANGIVYSADDADAINYAGVMLESWLSISDVSDPTILLAYANAELVYTRYGRQTYTLTPRQFGDIPRPYDDYVWGDQGYLSANKGSLMIDHQAVRIFSATITIDDNGNEIISDLQVALS